MIRHVSPVLSIDALSCREATTIKNRYQDDFSLLVVPIDFSPPSSARGGGGSNKKANDRLLGFDI